MQRGVPRGCRRQFPKVLTVRVVLVALVARMVQVVQMVQKDPVALVALVALMTAEHTGTKEALGKQEKA